MHGSHFGAYKPSKPDKKNIMKYLKSTSNEHRNICLIPSSAHGTNPASAHMCGMNVVVVACDEQGNVDIDDLNQKAAEHSDNLSAIMVTYPSTHGVFEENITELCDIVHQNGKRYEVKTHFNNSTIILRLDLTNTDI